MFTPDDNDWTDCDRPSNGGFDSRERLDYERQLLFSTDQSLGQHPMAQEVQTAPDCLNATDRLVGCVENRRWDYHDVMYATFNVQGSCNNLCDTTRQHVGATGDPEEWAARHQADLEWLRQRPVPMPSSSTAPPPASSARKSAAGPTTSGSPQLPSSSS